MKLALRVAAHTSQNQKGVAKYAIFGDIDPDEAIARCFSLGIDYSARTIKITPAWAEADSSISYRGTRSRNFRMRRAYSVYLKLWR